VSRTMDSFEELGLAPELVEALAADGVERPTSLQEAALPVIRRANNLFLAAGPGSGTTVAWGVALLDRVDSEGDTPRAVVLTPSRDRADQLAQSIGRLADSTGHRVAALGSHWVLPGKAAFLFGTPSDVLAAAKASDVNLQAVEAIVVDQASRIDAFEGMEATEAILEYVPKEAQRVVIAQPITPGVTKFLERHVKRAVTLPAEDLSTQDGPRRGTVRFRIAPEPREDAVLEMVSHLLANETRHVLVFCRNEDRAADVGDLLTLHGFVAGAPGDDSVPVWLGVDALSARADIETYDGVKVVSCDAPTDADELDRRHGASDQGIVVILSREVAHLRATARTAGYTVVPFPPEVSHGSAAVAGLQEQLRAALEAEDTAPYLLALEPLFEEHDPAEVAAAAVALLRKKTAPVAPPVVESSNAGGAAAPAWAKLFFGVGSRDGLTTGDLLGAITGEANVQGTSVGRIDIKESHTLVEVHDEVALQVITALNGTTINGRAVRADFDRPKRGTGGARKGPPRH
jgi:ATP-dependent RNA helicase DeaD